jgi:uncharacterized membrane protein YkvA (DUF1232 family)
MRLPRLISSAVLAYKRAWPLMRDERVPAMLKVTTLVLAFFIISPLDIFGDIPVLGLFDDAALLTFLCMLFVFLGTQAIEKNVTPPRNISGSPMVR